MSERRKGVSVGIFVDALNLIHSYSTYAALHGIGKVINCSKIFRACAGEGRVIKAVAYSGRNNLQGNGTFNGLNAALKLAGFELKLKETDLFESGKKKCNWDVGMAIDILKHAKKVQVIVLVTGDGDFIDLVRELQNEYQCEVEVMSFKSAMSYGLMSIADRYTFIDDLDFIKASPKQYMKANSGLIKSLIGPESDTLVS